MAPSSRPDFTLENAQDMPVCGLDEVGRGPLAGPVVAACVYIPDAKRELDFVAGIRDSKTLSAKRLETLFEQIQGHFMFGVASCSPQEIDDLNILQASLKAMERAYALLPKQPFHALIDGNRVPSNMPCPCTPVIKGESKSVSIAAASILAKVTRDRLMKNLAQDHPHYGWERNVGYPTQEHRDAIARYGITPHHRKSFAPVRKYIEAAQTTLNG